MRTFLLLCKYCKYTTSYYKLAHLSAFFGPALNFGCKSQHIILYLLVFIYFPQYYSQAELVHRHFV